MCVKRVTQKSILDIFPDAIAINLKKLMFPANQTKRSTAGVLEKEVSRHYDKLGGREPLQHLSE